MFLLVQKIKTAIKTRTANISNNPMRIPYKTPSDENILCVDLNEPEREIRWAKKFPLDLEPTVSGTLFNGFTYTKHADVLIVSNDEDRIKEKVISGETYRTGQYDSMDSKEFWGKVWNC